MPPKYGSDAWLGDETVYNEVGFLHEFIEHLGWTPVQSTNVNLFKYNTRAHFW